MDRVYFSASAKRWKSPIFGTLRLRAFHRNAGSARSTMASDAVRLMRK